MRQSKQADTNQLIVWRELLRKFKITKWFNPISHMNLRINNMPNILCVLSFNFLKDKPSKKATTPQLLNTNQHMQRRLTHILAETLFFSLRCRLPIGLLLEFVYLAHSFDACVECSCSAFWPCRCATVAHSHSHTLACISWILSHIAAVAAVAVVECMVSV